MSTTIDQRVVEMRFDNKQFESATATSMSTIDKLKQKLNFTGATKGLEGVGSAAKKIDMSGLGSAVDAVRVKFSSLQVIGVTALSNIANSAVNAGKRMISALTLDPITTGFQEYETQINAVQTILANTQSKGTTLGDVSAALDELNQYADQTIYNFTEMTRNIGTFTAAGVDLDKSVTAIKGIANLAAVSGSNATQASTAMYQLSQALAAGRVSLMDWNSVVNAGMGGEVFQTALKRTAEQMGTNVDALIEKYGSFRDSLTEGQWLTAEVLTETLTQLSGAYSEADLIAQGYTKQQAKDIVELANTAVSAATDVKTFTQLFDTLKESAQSGWTETWEILVGDFEESKALLSELSQTFGDIITSSADSRNDLLYDTMTSNWKKITDGITEAGLSADEFQTKVSEVAKSQGVDVDAMIKDYGSLEAAFKNGAISSDVLSTAITKMTGTADQNSKKLEELRGKYKTNEDVIKGLTDAGYEYSDIQNLMSKDAQGQAIALNDLTDAQLMSLGYTAQQVQSIRQYSENLELANGSLQSFIDNVSKPTGREMLIDTLRVSLRSLIDIFGAVGAAWRDVFPPTTSDQLLGIIESVRNFVLELRPTESTLKKIQSTFKGLFSILSIGKQAISAVLSPIGSMIGNFADLGGGILDVTASFGEWLYALDQSIKAGDSFASISNVITTVLDTVFDAIHSVVDGVGGFSGALSIVGDVVSSVFNGIKEVVGSVAGWIRDNITAGDIFAGLAGGGIFALAKKFSGLIDKIKDIFEGFGKGESPVGKFSEVLSGVHDSLESFQQGIQVAALVGIATAVTLLTSSLRKISELEPAEIAISLATIRLMISSLTSGFKSMAKTITRFNTSGVVKASISMIGIATAINILASAMEKMSALSLGDIAKSLVGISGGLLALSTSLKIIGTGGVTLRTSVAILALAQACKMLGDALQEFGTMSWGEIAKGLTAMGVALVELTAVMSVLSKVGGGRSLLGATSILIAVQSLDEIADALERLGNLSWGEITKGLVSMGGALAEFTAVLTILSKVGGFGALLGGTAILIAVQSLDEIADALSQLGQMSWGEIAKGLTAMGGALAELSVATGALGKIAGFSGIIGAGSILIVVQGLEDIANSLVTFGSMAWDEIGRGLTAMGGALAELGIVAGTLGTLAGFSGIIGAGSILIVVQGLGDLADAMQKFGSMEWSEIGRGLVAMGAALTELSVITGLTGAFTGFAGLVGAGTILLAVQGLNDLADAMIKFGSMSWDEIGRGLTAMGAALGETALGGLLNTFSGFGAAAIAEMAEPLGNLADSIKKWEDVTVPENLGTQLGSLADGVSKFTFGGWGADTISTLAEPIGTMADSMKKWSNVSISTSLGSELSSLADGVSAFNFSGWGAGNLSTAASGLSDMANSIKKWSDITIPSDLGSGLENLAGGVNAFSFAFVGGWSISSIIDPLSSLADTIKKWSKVTIPANIHTGLQNLADGIGAFNFSFVGGWSINSVVDPLSNLADAVKKWNGVSLSGVGSGLDELADGLTNLGNVGVKGLVSEFEGASDSINRAISGMLDGATSAVNAKKGEIAASFDGMMTESVSRINSHKGDFTNAASTLMTQFINAIKTKSTTVSNSFSQVLTQTVARIRSQYSSFYSAGSYIVDGLAAGIRANRGRAISEAQSMARAVESAAKAYLKIRSPSRVFKTIGGYIVQGLAEGITSDMSAEEAADQKAQNVVNAFQEEFDKLDVADETAKLQEQLNGAFNRTAEYERQVKRVELALGKYQNILQIYGKEAVDTQKAYNEYLQEMIDLNEVAAKTTQDAFEHSKNWIETNKEAGNLSLIDELAAWSRVQSRYVEGSEERIEADKEVLRLQQELAEATDDYYNSLMTLQEEANQKRLEIDQDYEDERVSIREDANKKLADLDQEYADTTQKINDQLQADIESLQKEYDDALNSRTNTLYNAYNLFDGVENQKEVSGETLMENLEEQLTAFKEWTDNINSLSSRGLDSELLDELREMGPSSAAEIAALNAMTDEELNKYVELWRTKKELAAEQATFELEGVREETQEQISQLTEDARKELREYRRAWSDEVQAVNDETDEKLRELRENWQSQIDELNEETTKQWKEIQLNWMTSVLDMKINTETELTRMITDMLDLLGKQTDWTEAGASMMEGVLQGIVGGAPNIYGTIEDVMQEALQIAKKALGINSPSKEFAKIGRYSNEGFAYGLKHYMGIVSDSSEQMGKSALESLRDALSNISDVLNADFDMQPTIRPVLDLSAVKMGANQLNTMFTRNKAVSVNASITQRANETLNDSNGMPKSKGGNVYQFTQNNYSPKALSRSEIYRQTKNQFSAMERMVET